MSELRREWMIDIGYGGREYFDSHDQVAERLTELIEDWGDDPPDTAPLVMSRYVSEWFPSAAGEDTGDRAE